MSVGYQVDTAAMKLSECEHQTKGKMERGHQPDEFMLQLASYDYLFDNSTTNQTTTDIFRMIKLL